MPKTLKPGDIVPLPRKVFESYFRGPLEDRKRVCRAYSHDDGSCLWHALHICLLKRQDLNDYERTVLKARKKPGHELRKRVANVISSRGGKQRWQRFWKKRGVKWHPTAKAILKRFNKMSTWSDVWMIVFGAHVLKINITFWDSKTNRVYCGLGGNDSLKSAFIWWQDHAHFEPILVLDKECSRPIINLFAAVDDVDTNDDAHNLSRRIATKVSAAQKNMCGDMEPRDIVPQSEEEDAEVFS